jgi:hypothetical protein
MFFLAAELKDKTGAKGEGRIKDYQIAEWREAIYNEGANRR